jgi:uncharacterized damage-inducible protein DinB
MIRKLAVLPMIACMAFAAEAPTVSRIFDGQLSNTEKEVVSLAEAMPPEHYDFAPTAGEFKGVRTFGQQAKHLAAVNYLVSAAALKEKPPVDTGGENGPESAKSKEQIVQFLKDSFAYSHKAAQALTTENQTELVKSPFGQGEMARGALVSIALWHTFDHYGQMVVYARMNGVVPPASK